MAAEIPFAVVRDFDSIDFTVFSAFSDLGSFRGWKVDCRAFGSFSVVCESSCRLTVALGILVSSLFAFGKSNF